MWEMRQIESMQRIRAAREALQPPPPPRRRGCPSSAELAARLSPELIAQAEARLDRRIYSRRAKVKNGDAVNQGVKDFVAEGTERPWRD
jgi:hypothetical protein